MRDKADLGIVGQFQHGDAIHDPDHQTPVGLLPHNHIAGQQQSDVRLGV